MSNAGIRNRGWIDTTAIHAFILTPEKANWAALEEHKEEIEG